jgi:tape measure domain-containing protein|nr:MAG TPA: tail tape measure protein [Caudoviricetes sp.]
MQNDKGKISFATGIDNSQLQADAQRARDILHGIGDTAKQEGAGIDSAFSKVAKTIGGIFAVKGIADFAKSIVSVRSEVQSLQISFETLLGSKDKATALFGEIRKFAANTPMMLKDLASGAQTMLAFNISAEKVMPMLHAIGDISMGDAQKFGSLTLAFSQMSATGKLMGQDLLQMINAGFNPLAEISAKTGKTIGELKEEMEKGKISVDMVTDAFLSATTEGGKFHGMLEKQSHGIAGAMSNLQGAVDDMFNDIGEASEGIIAGAISGATYVVKHYQEVGEALAVAAAMYGTYKAAVMATVAVETAAAGASAAKMAAIQAELAAVGVLTGESKLSADADIAAAVAKGTLTEAEGLQILALKQEAAARVAALNLAAEQAAASLLAARAAHKEAEARVFASAQVVANAQAELAAATAKGDMFVINAAKQNLETAAAERDTAVKQANAAAEVERTAAKRASTTASAAQTAQTELETVNTQVNTIAQETNSKATTVLAAAKAKLIGVIKKLWAALTAHPFALVAAAVIGAAYAIYKFITAESDAEAAQRKLHETIDECNRSIASERVQIDTLFNRLRRAKKGTEEYKTAKEAIISQYGQYLQGLSAEVQSLQDVEAAYKAITAAALEAARARALEKATKDAGDTYAEKETDAYERIEDALKDAYGETPRKGGGKAWEYWYGVIKEQLENGKTDKYGLHDFEKDSAWINNFKKRGGEYGKISWAIIDLEKAKKTLNDTIAEAERHLGGGSAAKTASKPEEKKEKSRTEYNANDWEKYKKQKEDEYKALTEAERTSAKGRKIKQEIAEADKKLKGWDTGTSGTRTGGGATSDAAQIARETAERTQRIKDSAEAIKQAQREAELDIRQEEINLMQDGVDKELAQNELNYQRLENANIQRRNEMLEKIRDIKELEWENANPKAKKEGKTFDRSSIGDDYISQANIDNLRAAGNEAEAKQLEDMLRQLQEYERIAGQIRDKGNREVLEKMLADVLTYQQQREKIEKEYAAKRANLYTTDKDGNKTLRNGVTQGNLDELQLQETKALEAVDEQFAQREETYQSWCSQIASITLDELTKVLQEAQTQLDALEKSGNADPQQLAVARAKVAKAQDELNKRNANKNTNLSPGKRSVKEWEDLYKTLSEVEKEFVDLGKTVGGTLGDIISICGSFATSTLTMINGIMTLAQWSTRATEMAAQGASKAIQQVEKASVILTIISASLQIAMQIANLFNNDAQKQKEIEALQNRIDQLQWELDNADTLRWQREYGSALVIVNKALGEARTAIAANSRGWGKLVAQTARASKNASVMADTVDRIAKAYANMSYTADKALGADKFSGAIDKLRNIAQQQVLINEQIELEASKKDKDSSKIADWKQKIEELGQDALDIINEMVEDIIGDTSSGIAEELANAFFDAFEAGEDAAQAWGDKVNEIVADVLKRMLISKFLEEPLGKVLDKYKSKWFKDGEFMGIDNVIKSMQSFGDDLNNVGTNWNAIWDVLPDTLKETMKNASQSAREGASEGIAQASQDSVDELNGRATAIQSHTYSISENTKLLLNNTNSILQSVMHIESETDGMSARLARIETQTKTMGDTLDDIALRGIKLKN